MKETDNRDSLGVGTIVEFEADSVYAPWFCVLYDAACAAHVQVVRDEARERVTRRLGGGAVGDGASRSQGGVLLPSRAARLR